jgi:hypothetical protein
MLLLTRLDYGNAVLYGHPVVRLCRLEKTAAQLNVFRKDS